MKEKKKLKLGWFQRWGFESDPFLSEQDKKYYREKREKFYKQKSRIGEFFARKEDLSFQRRLSKDKKQELLIGRAVKRKKADWLGSWLEKFSVEGDFWRKRTRADRKDEWL